MATFDGVTAPTIGQAIEVRLREVLGVNEDGTFTPDLERVRAWAVDVVNSQPQPYTAPEYIEARRWQQQPDTTLALDTGRLSAAEYAAVVVSGYEAAQRTLKMRLSLLAQAKTIDEIEAILGRL